MLSYTQKNLDNVQRPIILLVHGFCESKEIWKDFTETLGNEGYGLLVPDLGGFGQSADLLPIPHSIEALAEQINDLLIYHKIDQVVWIGHSLGGYVALAFAEKYPAKVKGLCLFHSTAFPDTAEKKETRDKTIAHVQKVGVEKYIESFVSSLFYKVRHQELKEVIKQVENIGKQTPQETITSTLATMRERPDRTHILEKANYPVMFIIGKEDSAIAFESYEQQTKLAKKPVVHTLEKSGHMGLLEYPEETMQMVRDFYEVCLRG